MIGNVDFADLELRLILRQIVDLFYLLAIHDTKGE